jgi:hypothetical protein
MTLSRSSDPSYSRYQGLPCSSQCMRSGVDARVSSAHTHTAGTQAQAACVASEQKCASVEDTGQRLSVRLGMVQSDLQQVTSNFRAAQLELQGRDEVIARLTNYVQQKYVCRSVCVLVLRSRCSVASRCFAALSGLFVQGARMQRPAAAGARIAAPGA